jgi:hypothetical protein
MTLRSWLHAAALIALIAAASSIGTVLTGGIPCP